jgi:hypothetical protein
VKAADTPSCDRRQHRLRLAQPDDVVEPLVVAEIRGEALCAGPGPYTMTVRSLPTAKWNAALRMGNSSSQSGTW